MAVNVEAGRWWSRCNETRCIDCQKKKKKKNYQFFSSFIEASLLRDNESRLRLAGARVERVFADENFNHKWETCRMRGAAFTDTVPGLLLIAVAKFYQSAVLHCCSHGLPLPLSGLPGSEQVPSEKPAACVDLRACELPRSVKKTVINFR